MVPLYDNFMWRYTVFFNDIEEEKLTYDVIVTVTMYQIDAFLREINYQSTKKSKWIYYINLYKFNEYLYSKIFLSLKLG